MTAEEPTIHELIGKSSLGSDAAKSLRRRTTDEQLDLVRRHAADRDLQMAWARARSARSADGTVTLVAESDRSMDDDELMQLHAAGDPDAFTVLVERHRDRMWAVAIRTLGESDEAAEALETAFGTAFLRAGSFRGDTKVVTWLHRIVVNACLDCLRRRQGRGSDEPGPPTAKERQRRLDLLAAMERLDAGQREALVLVDIEGRSLDEAALILGCSRAAVVRRCARARTRLRPLLGDVMTSPDSESAD
ncbi:hypothetical protein GCM10009745_26020 [Kribbella yunnanensis]|uniref:RNA polymerase sigma factor SigM n=1 Tax=Kribbella yunnanensis TaxID=190194 RepID=A0ABP4T1M5_9ACTN